MESWLGPLGAPHEPVEVGEAGTYSRAPTPPTCPHSQYTHFCLNRMIMKGEGRNAPKSQMSSRMEPACTALCLHTQRRVSRSQGRTAVVRERTPAAVSTPHICIPETCWGPKAGDHGVPAERSLMKVQKHSPPTVPQLVPASGAQTGQPGEPPRERGQPSEADQWSGLWARGSCRPHAADRPSKGPGPFHTRCPTRCDSHGT